MFKVAIDVGIAFVKTVKGVLVVVNGPVPDAVREAEQKFVINPRSYVWAPTAAMSLQIRFKLFEAIIYNRINTFPT